MYKSMLPHQEIDSKTKMTLNMCNPPLLFLILVLFLIANTNHASNRSVSLEIPTRIIAGLPNSPGQFMASIGVGTPPQEFLLVADTGSHQTWLNCNYTCPDCPVRSPSLMEERLFQARSSSSFEFIPCMSEYCETVTYRRGCVRPKPLGTPCGYELRYGDGSSTRGIYMNETMTFKRHNRTLRNVLVGCTASVAGYLGGADGLLGLGSSMHSFAAKAAREFGNKFSYCWTDILKPRNNLKTYLNFGKNTPATLSSKMQYTVIDFEQPPYYKLNLTGMSINGLLLNISGASIRLNRQERVVIDSGLTLTVLKEAVYEPVMAALKTALLKYKVVESSFFWGNGVKLEYCFESTNFDESVVPKLAFHFWEGVRFEPPVRNYVVEVEHGVRCLAFFNGEQMGIFHNIIGSIMQQGYHWEYDLATNKLGFAPSTCVYH